MSAVDVEMNPLSRDSRRSSASLRAPDSNNDTSPNASDVLPPGATFQPQEYVVDGDGHFQGTKAPFVCKRDAGDDKVCADDEDDDNNDFLASPGRLAREHLSAAAATSSQLVRVTSMRRRGSEAHLLALVGDISQREASEVALLKTRCNGASSVNFIEKSKNHHHKVAKPTTTSDDDKQQQKQKEEADSSSSWSIDYDFNNGGLIITNSTCIHRVHILSVLVRACLLILVWVLLRMLLDKDKYLLERGGNIFDPLVCFVMCSLIGKLIGAVLGVPPLIVIFVAGLMWTNVPTFQFLTSGITDNVRMVIGRVALATILVRTGLAVTPKTLAPAKWNILAMSFLPLLTEVLVHGFVAQALFPDYKEDEPLWPFLQAMVAAPSASGVVAAVVMIIQQQGYTKTRGPGVLLIPACALDMTLGVWGVNFVSDLLARDPNESLAWPILQGPVQIMVGAVAGVALGVVWYAVLLVFFSEAQPLPSGVDGEEKKKSEQQQEQQSRYAGAFVEQVSVNASVVLGMFGCFTIFVAYWIKSAGGGCIACTMLGATAQYLTTREGEQQEHEEQPVEVNDAAFGQPVGTPVDADEEKKKGNDDDKKKQQQQQQQKQEEKPGCLRSIFVAHRSPEEHRYVRTRLVVNFAALWDQLVMPALFAFSASTLDIRAMFDPSTVGAAIGTIFIAFIARSAVTALCCWSYPLMTRSEFIICSIALGGKAFAQVALGNSGYGVLQRLNTANMTAADLALRKEWASHAANTGALSVLFISPIVVVLLSVVGPKCFWLTDKEMSNVSNAQRQEEKEKEKQQQEEAAAGEEQKQQQQQQQQE